MSVYWADGELVIAPIDTGDGKSVTSRGNISVKMNPIQRGKVILERRLY